MNINDITFVITTFKSEKIIFDCINSLPENSHKIVIENSNNHQMKLDLEKKYKNIECHIMEANLGYGRANNYGIKKAKTKYVLILNPDARLNSNTLEGIINILKNQNFCIASPLENNQNDINFSNKNFLDVEYVKGFAMLLNLEKMKFGYFDEQIFLYLEEIDLCKRAKDVGEKILLLNIKIDHAGGFSHGSRDNLEMEKSRNWHWMWSKFYFNKKHYGYLKAYLKTLPNFASSIAKFLIYFMIRNKTKKSIYLMRLSGLLASYLNKASYYRPFKNE
mgnify:FL=1